MKLYQKCGVIFLVATAGLLLSNQSNAYANENALFSEAPVFVATVSGGFFGPRNFKMDTIFLEPDVQKAYTVNALQQTLRGAGLFLGVQENLPCFLQGQLGIEGNTLSTLTVSGNIWDDADPNFNNFVYRYYIKHSDFLVKTKLLWAKYPLLTPWLSAGAGLARNISYQFNNTPLIDEAFPDENFRSHTQKSLTYSVGAGLQTSLNDNFKVAVAYAFSDLGKSSLRRTQNQIVDSGIAHRHFYSNAILVNVSVLI